MKLPRDLSGHDLATGLCIHIGYEKVDQAGSHSILQTREPTPHRIAVRAHSGARRHAEWNSSSRCESQGSRPASHSRVSVIALAASDAPFSPDGFFQKVDGHLRLPS